MPGRRGAAFDPAISELTFRIAASDYLDPLFLPSLVGHLQHAAPSVRLELMPLTAEYDYRRHLATVLARRAVEKALGG